MEGRLFHWFILLTVRKSFLTSRLDFFFNKLPLIAFAWYMIYILDDVL